ncbi:hypothetical protein Tco_0388956 [Tanacetum coccineum]
MLAERRYPLIRETLDRMMKLRLTAESEGEDGNIKNWLVQKQTTFGKDFSNPFIADSLLKTIWFSTHHASHAPCYSNEALAIPEQTATVDNSIWRIHFHWIQRIQLSVQYSVFIQLINTAQFMTRSSTNELFTPYKEPEREFRSSRRHFKTLSLDELRSPDFNLFSDQEYSKEEEAETMAETMEQYMSKTRANYGSGGSDHEDANEHTEKVLEIVDLFHIPNITIDQVTLRAFLMSLTGAASRWLRNKPTGDNRVLDSRGAIPSKTAADAKIAIQEMAEYSQNWHNGTSSSRSAETSDG